MRGGITHVERRAERPAAAAAVDRTVGESGRRTSDNDEPNAIEELFILYTNRYRGGGFAAATSSASMEMNENAGERSRSDRGPDILTGVTRIIDRTVFDT